jgi:hypothetical protein
MSSSVCVELAVPCTLHAVISSWRNNGQFLQRVACEQFAMGVW